MNTWRNLFSPTLALSLCFGFGTPYACAEGNPPPDSATSLNSLFNVRAAIRSVYTSDGRSIEDRIQHEPPSQLSRAWSISLASLIASQALDAHSSYGMHELNPILASPDGHFGGRATAMKFGVISGLIGAEYLIVRKYPRAAKAFSVVNWTSAGITTGLAVHNYNLR